MSQTGQAERRNLTRSTCTTLAAPSEYVLLNMQPRVGRYSPLPAVSASVAEPARGLCPQAAQSM